MRPDEVVGVAMIVMAGIAWAMGWTWMWGAALLLVPIWLLFGGLAERPQHPAVARHIRERHRHVDRRHRAH